MSDKKLVVLGIVAASMLVLAIVQSKFATGPAEISQGVAPLVQGLDPDTIGGIRLKGKEGSGTLERKGTGFVVADKFGYSALTNRVNDLIQKVLDIRTIDHVTDDPANFADLGVDPNSARTVVEFLDKDGKVMTGVVISEMKNGKTYVREPNRSDVYEAHSGPWIDTKAVSYLEQRITDIKQEDIARVTITTADGSWSLSAEPNGTVIKIEKDIPEGKQLKPGDDKQVFSVLTNLRFEDVQPDSDLAFRDSYVCKLHKPVTYTVRIAASDDKTFAKIAAQYTGPEQVFKAEGQETEQELKAKEALLLTQDQVKEFNAQHSKWVYQIPIYQAKNLTRKFEDLLEDIKKEEEKPAETKTEPAPGAEAAQPAPPVEMKAATQEANAPAPEQAETVPPLETAEPTVE